MNLFTEQLNLSNEPIQKSPIKLPVLDENGEKKHLMISRKNIFVLPRIDIELIRK